ncbi:MAG: ParA family protein [Cyclobacteriaceae bacterium]|nr:ParA family protein [Cyclobacteriaceae bacterium]
MSLKVVAIVNQKGGTGKTTTTVNLGSAFASNGHRVLLIDLDPQGNLTYSLGINEFENGIDDVLKHEALLSDSIIERENMDVLPATTNLAKLELMQLDSENTAYILSEALSDAVGEYDYILIDCPPSLSWLTINALTAAHKVLVPMQLDVFSIQGLTQIMETVGEIKSAYNEELSIAGVLAVMVDKRKKLTNEVLEHVKGNFDVSVFENVIRTNVKAAEAPSFGASVVHYSPNSNSARDYLAAAKEILEII